MTTIKITKRDNYKELRNVVENTVYDTEVQNRLLAFLDHEIELLDKRNASSAKYSKRSNKAADELAQRVEAVVTSANEPLTIPQIVERIDLEGVTAAKVSYRLTKLVEAGALIREVVSIKPEGQSARRVNTYKAVDTEIESGEE